MSRRDYEMLAKHIAIISDTPTRQQAFLAVTMAIRELGYAFDFARFAKACNVNPQT